jgi:hypothetical protein
MQTALVQQFVNQVDRNLTKDPTGFVDPDLVEVTYDPVTRKVTLTGTVRTLWRGSESVPLSSGWVSEAHDDVAGSYFLYWDGTAFVWSNSAWKFSDLQIAFIWYGASDKWALRECHGLMEASCHHEFHKVIGTYRETGGTLSGYTLASTVAANRRPLISACEIWDEDTKTVNAALSSASYTLMNLTGATGIPVWTKASADIALLSGNQPYYNQFTAGAWKQTLLPNNAYMSLWLMAVPVSNDAGSQVYRFIWLQGQTQSTNLATIQANDTKDLDLGEFKSIVPEFVFIARVIIRYSGGNWALTQVNNLTGSKATQVGSPAGFYLSSVTTDGTLTGTGTVASPLRITGVDQNGKALANRDDSFLDALIFG